MAKALFGYLSNPDPRVLTQLSTENRRLRRRVADLEAHLSRLSVETDALAAIGDGHALLALDESMQPV